MKLQHQSSLRSGCPKRARSTRSAKVRVKRYAKDMVDRMKAANRVGEVTSAYPLKTMINRLAELTKAELTKAEAKAKREAFKADRKSGNRKS